MISAMVLAAMPLLIALVAVGWVLIVDALGRLKGHDDAR